MTKILLIIAGISGLLAVGLGAFGAHALKTILSEPMQAVYRTAVDYQFVHTLAIIACAILALQFPAISQWQWAGIAFIVGIVIFSSSLYVLAITEIKILGAITPIGGVCFLIGWLLFITAAIKSVE